jgi:hypothetical protein
MVLPTESKNAPYSEDMRVKVRSYLGIDLRKHTLINGRDPELVKEAVNGYLADMYEVWWKLNEQVTKLHESKLESGARETIPARQPLPRSNGDYVRTRSCGTQSRNVTYKKSPEPFLRRMSLSLSCMAGWKS